MITIHDDAAIDRLMRFLAVEGVTGHEAAIGRVVAGELRSIGVPGDAIRFDDANTRIPLPTETGNLIVMLPGTRTVEVRQAMAGRNSARRAASRTVIVERPSGREST